jgi:hypothetical protein
MTVLPEGAADVGDGQPRDVHGQRLVEPQGGGHQQTKGDPDDDSGSDAESDEEARAVGGFGSGGHDRTT